MRSIRQDIEKIVYTEEQLKEKVKELAARISAETDSDDLVVVGILKGAAMFMSDLIREIDGPLRTDYMVISSYGSSHKTSGIVRIIKDLESDITGCSILVVEDVVDTGVTLAYLKDYLLERGAKDVRFCAMIDKINCRIKDIRIDYTGFEDPDDSFLVGYGMDYAEHFRNLPFIGIPKKGVINE